MNEKVVAVEIDGIEGGTVTHVEGRSWDFAWGTGRGPILLILDGTGRIIAAHRDWVAVRLDDAPGRGSAA